MILFRIYKYIVPNKCNRECRQEQKIRLLMMMSSFHSAIQYQVIKSFVCKTVKRSGEFDLTTLLSLVKFEILCSTFYIIAGAIKGTGALQLGNLF